MEIPGRGFGVFRVGESPERGYQPTALFRDRGLALLIAAVLPSTGSDATFRLAKEAGPEGFAVQTGDGDVVGYVELFDERLIDAFEAAEGLLRSPEALANVLEAAGQVALERAGAILDERVS